jgi:hypothetical protein
MIDYHGHMAVLNACVDTIRNTVFTDADQQKLQARTLAALDDSPDTAILGAFIDHMMAHAVSDGSELALLQQAADLWREGRAICDDVGTARTLLEGALTNPGSPASLGDYKAAIDLVGTFEHRVTTTCASVMALVPQVSPPRYLAAHPRQEDQPTPRWNWGDLFLARRTDAFARNVAAAASDSEERALAFGILTSYAGNAAGSAYIARSVGGPRRAHPYRDRLARYATGAWLRKQKLSSVALDVLADRLRWGSPFLPPRLSPKLEALITKVLEATYEPRLVPPVPDLQIGYGRLLRHLRLLSVFEVPPVPPPLVAALNVRKQANPDAFPPIISDTTHPTSGGPPPPPTGNLTIGSNDSEETKKKTCLAILGIVLLAIGVALLCIFTLGAVCGGSSSPPPNPRDPQEPGRTAAALTAFAATPEAVHVADVLQQVHQFLWQAFSVAEEYLMVGGYIYPDDDRLGMKPHGQFLTMRAPAPHPHRAPAKPNVDYEPFPTTPIENPASPGPVSFPTGSTPAAYVVGTPAAAHLNARDFAMSLWNQLARQEKDSANLDMDADRDTFHECWDIVNGSIRDNPVPVTILNYAQTGA